MSKEASSVLIVDDDHSLLSTLHVILADTHRVLTATSGNEALSILESHPVDIILLDMLLPDWDGLDLLQEIRRRDESIDVIVLTALNDVQRAVTSIKLGAYQYLTKDFAPDEIRLLLERLIKQRRQLRAMQGLQSEVDSIHNKNMILGQSPATKPIYELAKRIADLPATVLVQGESGVGKELLARFIHRHSSRAQEPFVSLHVASLPKNLLESALFGHERGAFTGATKQQLGRFEMADGGTLFLDEVGEIDLDVQVKLLRFLQEGEFERIGSNRTLRVDVRLIAATHRDLAAMVQKGEFRKDLFYRLNVIPVTLPPLRQRREEVAMLSRLFLGRYCKRFGKEMMTLSERALKIMENYSWPGNIRELEHLIERLVAIVQGCHIDESDIPIEYCLSAGSVEGGCSPSGNQVFLPESDGSYLRQATEVFERQLIGRALVQSNGNRRKTAERLGIPLSTLKFKLQKLGIHDTRTMQS